MPVSRDQRRGYLLIDQRACDRPLGARFLEADTFTCAHCEAQIVRNPTRERARHHCYACDRYICDACAPLYAVAGCKPLAKVIDEHFRSASRIRIF